MLHTRVTPLITYEKTVGSVRQTPYPTRQTSPPLPHSDVWGATMCPPEPPKHQRVSLPVRALQLSSSFGITVIIFALGIAVLHMLRFSLGLSTSLNLGVVVVHIEAFHLCLDARPPRLEPLDTRARLTPWSEDIIKRKGLVCNTGI